MASISIERGLFKFDFTDHYAILGISLEADGKQIRKRYLKVVQRLHPDTCKAESEAEKAKANQILSRLVNPAYEHLQKDRSRAEYQLIFPQLGQRLAQEGGKIKLVSETAKELAKVDSSAIEEAYASSLKEIAANQYEDLKGILDQISQISELNLVYLLKKYGDKIKQEARQTVSDKDTSSQTTTTQQESPKSATGSLVDSYTRRAEEYLNKENYARAILELREGLKLDPNDSSCHSLLGWAYLKQGQLKMAKIHIDKALKSNPQDAKAMQAKEMLNKKTGGKKDRKNVPSSDPSKQSGGILGSLFGKNK